ncbi:MAG: pyridoxamine 5'-phosphate oxidase [Desulfobulbus propionicus]|nr:MAG: pyridoxamine 5'-phosphate oxidase [Desulfobulbus propionicus]
MDLHQLRQDYTQAELNRNTLSPDPFAQFEKWFEEALSAELWEPNAMCLGTVNSAGQPSQRTVLLKFFDTKGFVFFTNYTSTKAREIEKNPKVSLLFPWLLLERQVIIQGTTEKISMMESARYFASRPKESQIGAWISPQSSEIDSRALLLQKLNEVKKKFSQGKIPLPDFWGGYRIRPHSFEFWQGRKARLHDRFQYRSCTDGSWSIHRLAP